MDGIANPRPSTTIGATAPGPWRRELAAFTRAFSGSALFGMPLLYTMEMWTLGAHIESWRLLVLLGLGLAANLGLCYFAGFRGDKGLRASAHEAVDAVAVGLIGAAVVLLILGRIGPGDPWSAVTGKILIQAIPLSIGASVANAVFRDRGQNRQGDGDTTPKPGAWRIVLNDAAATVIGGVFIGLSIVPTDEVEILAAGLATIQLLAVIGLSLLLAYLIVFASEFDASSGDPGRWIPFQHPVTETAFSYGLSLLVALGTLALFDRIHAGEPIGSIVAQVIVLGLPVSVGGAAGRLVI